MKLPHIPPIALNVSTLASTLTLITATTFYPMPRLASISTATLFGSIMAGVKQERRERIEDVQAELQRMTQQLTERDDEARALDLKVADLTLQLQQIDALRHTVDNANSAREMLVLDLDTARRERLQLENENANANSEVTRAQAEAQTLRDTLEAQRKEWVAKFDALITEYEAKVEALTDANRELDREATRYRDNKDLIVQTETFKVKERAVEVEARLTSLAETNRKLSAHVTESANVIGDLQGEFAYLTSDGFAELQTLHSQQLETCQAELKQLQHTVAVLSAPLMFEQIGDYARADRLIAELFKRTGNTLDASEITPVDDGAFDVALNVRDRKARGAAFVKSLTDLGDVLMVDTACIEPLKFRFDAQNPHRILTRMRYRKAVASPKSLPWKVAAQFAGLAGKWNRVRVTGGSESGKSPMAELIVASMQQAKGSMSVALAFPLTDSVKNHWTLKVTHSDGYRSVLDCAREAVAMMATSPPMFHVAVLDECDTALTEHSELAAEVKALIKTGSHANVGCVLLGQNANVRQWKGFDRSDFENIVNVHLGGNAYHAIENSNLSQAAKDKLKQQADTLTRHCETVNEGVEEPDKLTRFALVVDPKASPYFVEVPTFGSMTFDYSKALTATAQNVPPVESGIACTHCGGDKFKRNGSYANGDARYKCSSRDCGKAFRTVVIGQTL